MPSYTLRAQNLTNGGNAVEPWTKPDEWLVSASVHHDDGGPDDYTGCDFVITAPNTGTTLDAATWPLIDAAIQKKVLNDAAQRAKDALAAAQKSAQAGAVPVGQVVSF